MVVIFGWGEGEAQDLGEVAPVICPNCHNHVFLHHIRSEKRISLYFVPLVPYGSNDYMACPVCRQGLQIRPEQRPPVDEMQALTALFRRGTVDEAYYRARVERFWTRLGVSPSGEQVVHASPGVLPASANPRPAGPAPDAAPSLASQLEGLGQLHRDGVLTDGEFAAAKRRLLGS